MAEKTEHTGFLRNLFKLSPSRDRIHCFLESVELFGSIPAKHLKALSEILEYRVYSESETLYRQGDPATSLYLIVEGEIQTSMTGKDKIPILINKFGHGDFVGELGIFPGMTRHSTATAISELSVLALLQNDMFEFIEQYPKSGLGILKGISQIAGSRLELLHRDYNLLSTKKP